MLGDNLDEVKNNVKVKKTIKKVVKGNSENPEVVEETVYYDKNEMEKFENFENQDFELDGNADNIKKNVTVEEDENGTITKVVNIEYSLLEDDVNNEGDIIIETSYINDGNYTEVNEGEKSFITNMDSVILDGPGGISLIESKEKLDKIDEGNEKVEEKSERSLIQQVKSVFTGKGKTEKEETKPKVTTTTKRVYSKDLYSYDDLDETQPTEEIINIQHEDSEKFKTPPNKSPVSTPVDDEEYVSASEIDNSTLFSNFKVNVPGKEQQKEEEVIVVEDGETSKNNSLFGRFKFNLGKKK